MSNNPISEFIQSSHCFHVHDLSVLLCLIAAQETSHPFNAVSPAAADKRITYLEGITDEEWSAAFARLMLAGELRWVDDGRWRGYQVVRFEELHDSLADYGKRRYFRNASRISREKKGQSV